MAVTKLKRKIRTDNNIVYELTRKQVKVQYRDSSLGFLWTVLHPLLNMLVMWLVFTQFFGKTDPYYSIYLLCGNILFAALRSSTEQSLGSIVGHRSLLLRTKVEFHIFPLSNVCTSLVNFLFSLIALLPFMIWLSIQEGISLFSFNLLFILLMLPALFIFEYGIGLFLSVIFIYFRDIKHLYAVFLTLWTYITPIFYKSHTIKGAVSVILKLNPMYHFVLYFRECVYLGAAGIDSTTCEITKTAPKIAPYIPVWNTLGYCYGFAAIALLIGGITFLALRKKAIMRI